MLWHCPQESPPTLQFPFIGFVLKQTCSTKIPTRSFRYTKSLAKQAERECLFPMVLAKVYWLLLVWLGLHILSWTNHHGYRGIQLFMAIPRWCSYHWKGEWVVNLTLNPSKENGHSPKKNEDANARRILGKWLFGGQIKSNYRMLRIISMYKEE